MNMFMRKKHQPGSSSQSYHASHALARVSHLKFYTVLLVLFLALISAVFFLIFGSYAHTTAGAAIFRYLVLYVMVALAACLLLAQALAQTIRALLSENNRQMDLHMRAQALEAEVESKTKHTLARQTLLDHFLNNTDTLLYLKNTDCEFVMVNKGFAQWVGKSYDEILGKTVVTGNPEELQFREVETQALTEKRAQSFEFAVETPTGGTNFFVLSAFPISDGGGNITGLGGMVTNVTQHKRMEMALMEAKNAAEEAGRTKASFLVNMSHEIRTPLNGILGMADLLQHAGLTQEQAAMAAAIKNSGNGLLDILNDILDFSKMEAGKLQLDPHPFNLRDMIFGHARSMAVLAHKKGLELLVHIDPQVPKHLLGDKQRLGQVMLNLLSNSIKFTHEGEICIGVNMVGGDTGDALVRFSVSDTGIGISPEKQQSIFEAFVQADSSTTRKYGGTGLGLSISSRLVRLMHSQLYLESRPDHGSSFWFDVRLPAAGSEKAQRRQATRAGLAQGRRALVVEGNASSMDILTTQLRAWGLEVEGRATCGEAIVRLRMQGADMPAFDLIIVALPLHLRENMCLLDEIAENKRLANTPVILLTSGPSPSAEPSLPHIRAKLLKPVHPSELLDALLQALGLEEKPQETTCIWPQDGAKTNAGRYLKILMAEDMQINQLVGSSMLRSLGHEVSIAADGNEALALLEKDDFDLVFMDIQMPVMDGIAAVKALRAAEAEKGSPHMPVVAMTAHALEPDNKLYKDSGLDAYLSKPMLIDDVAAVIDKITQQFCLNWRTRELCPPQAATTRQLLDCKLLGPTFGGDQDLVRQSMRIYIEDAPNLVRAIEASLQACDNAALAENSHALKGITSYYNKGMLYAKCLGMEKAGRGGRLPEAKGALLSSLDELKQDICALISQLEDYLNTPQEQ